MKVHRHLFCHPPDAQKLRHHVQLKGRYQIILELESYRDFFASRPGKVWKLILTTGWKQKKKMNLGRFHVSGLSDQLRREWKPQELFLSVLHFLPLLLLSLSCLVQVPIAFVCMLATSPFLEPPSLVTHLELSLGKADGSPFVLAPSTFLVPCSSQHQVLSPSLVSQLMKTRSASWWAPSSFWTNATFPVKLSLSNLVRCGHADSVYLSYYLPKALICTGLAAFLTILPIWEWAVLCACPVIGMQQALQKGLFSY